MAREGICQWSRSHLCCLIGFHDGTRWLSCGKWQLEVSRPRIKRRCKLLLRGVSECAVLGWCLSLTSIYCFCEANSSVKDPCLWKRPAVWKASQLSLRGRAEKDHCLLNNNNNSILIRSFETVSPGVVEACSVGTQKLLIKAFLQRIHVLNLRRKNASFKKKVFFFFSFSGHTARCLGS